MHFQRCEVSLLTQRHTKNCRMNTKVLFSNSFAKSVLCCEHMKIYHIYIKNQAQITAKYKKSTTNHRKSPYFIRDFLSHRQQAHSRSRGLRYRCNIYWEEVCLRGIECDEAGVECAGVCSKEGVQSVHPATGTSPHGVCRKPWRSVPIVKKSPGEFSRA